MATKINWTEVWEDGDLLDSAWFTRCDPKLREQYRNSDTERRTGALEHLMKGDVHADLKTGSVTAVGYMVEPELRDVPEPLGKFLFEERTIDWENSIVKALRREFNLVRIAKDGWQVGHDMDQGSASISEDSKPGIEITSSTSSIESPVPAKRGGGRANRYPEAEVVLSALYKEDESRRGLSAALLLADFNLLFFKMHPALLGKVAAVSERTLRVYLSKYRLAETGENRQK